MESEPLRNNVRTGYAPHFLAVRVDAPPAPEPAAESPLLTYTHFTVCLNTRRRLAWWVAWNIDGLRLHPGEGSLGRDGIDFVADDRVPREHQALDDVYYRNRFDRGHLARRADLLWGDLDEAKEANLDSFYFPNIAPQMDIFNQSRRAPELPPPDPASAAESWGLLENAVLAFDGLDERRVSVLAGPVLSEHDPEHFGLQIPRDFWKVLIYAVNGALRYKAFVLSQDITVTGVRRLDYLAEFDTYMVDLSELESRTGLSFEALSSTADAVHQLELRVEDPIRVTDVTLIDW